MNDHDPYCPDYGKHRNGMTITTDACICAVIAKVGERIAQAIEALQGKYQSHEEIEDAARIARNGGRDE